MRSDRRRRLLSEDEGARGSEIVKLCLSSRAGARRSLSSGRAPRREVRVPGGRARPGLRVLASARTPRRLRAVSPAAGPSLGARGATAASSRSRASRARGRMGAGERGGRREGGPAELPPGPGCACASRLLKTKHVPKAVFAASGRFLHPQFPPLGWRRPTRGPVSKRAVASAPGFRRMNSSRQQPRGLVAAPEPLRVSGRNNTSFSQHDCN
ncbi:translation initiation factor IF-2-like [Sturnira hondurensis]|uniref:translation initiation factor IF-2-like n=1 Tax=Sturnira hondurensis TaxID=192404 RepID=UPI00187A03A0|nr:translation initiation factor IF-2-like [Sturnira hondurensis]